MTRSKSATSSPLEMKTVRLDRNMAGNCAPFPRPPPKSCGSTRQAPAQSEAAPNAPPPLLPLRVTRALWGKLQKTRLHGSIRALRASAALGQSTSPMPLMPTRLQDPENIEEVCLAAKVNGFVLNASAHLTDLRCNAKRCRSTTLRKIPIKCNAPIIDVSRPGLWSLNKSR